MMLSASTNYWSLKNQKNGRTIQLESTPQMVWEIQMRIVPFLKWSLIVKEASEMFKLQNSYQTWLILHKWCRLLHVLLLGMGNTWKAGQELKIRVELSFASSSGSATETIASSS